MDAALVRALMKDDGPAHSDPGDPRERDAVTRPATARLPPTIARSRTIARTTSSIQAMLTMNLLKAADTPALVSATMAANTAKGVQIVGAAILDPTANQYVGRGAAANVGGGPAPFTADEQTILARGQTIYSETCFACHGDDGRGAALPGAAPGVTRAPSLVGSPRVLGHRDYVTHGLLSGLTGPVDGQRYDETMIPMGANPG